VQKGSAQQIPMAKCATTKSFTKVLHIACIFPRHTRFLKKDSKSKRTLWSWHVLLAHHDSKEAASQQAWSKPAARISNISGRVHVAPKWHQFKLQDR